MAEDIIKVHSREIGTTVYLHGCQSCAESTILHFTLKIQGILRDRKC